MCAKSQSSGVSAIEKLGLEVVDDSVDISNTRKEGVSNLQAVASAASFVEKYLNFRSTLHAHFAFFVKGELGKVDTCDLCAVFERAPATIRINRNGGFVVVRIGEISSPKVLSNDEEYAVFVDDVEFRNYPEIAERGFLPHVRSIVRLQLLQVCKCVGVDKRLDQFPGLGEIGLTDVNRKKRVPTTGNIVAVQDRQLTNEVVQGGAEVVDDVAYQERPVGIIGSYFSEGNNHVLPFSVMIEKGAVVFRFRGTPLFDCSLQLREVVFRTLDFESDSGGSCTHKSRQ
jgi:hypothetical protein